MIKSEETEEVEEIDNMNKIINKIICFISLAMVLYTLAVKFYFPPGAFINRGIYLLFSIVLVFCFQFPKSKGVRRYLLVLGTMFAVSATVYVMIASGKIIENWYMATNAEFYVFVLYFIGILLISQDSTGGRIISIMAIVSVIYLYVGRFVPGYFYLPIFNIRQIATMVFTDIDKGAFGVFLSLLARVLSVYFMFASLLLVTGLGDVIRACSMLAAGKARGGPAKVAVIASGLFGMISGSPVSNVAATGSFTIPLMKSIGYKPESAAAIETIASSGGTLAPPIMGLTAFIMAEITGFPYVQIIVWAIIPAFLWYFTTFLVVHYGALSQNIKAWAPPRKELIETIKTKGHLLISILVLIIFLVYLQIPEIAALYSIVVLFLLSIIKKETRLNWERTQKFLINFGRTFSQLCMLNTMLGIFVAVLLSTGTHRKLLYFIYGGQTSWISILLITFIICIIFGMLVPPFAAYVTVVLIVVPLFSGLGFSLPVIHFFVIYACVLAPITPPVALAAFTAAAIAGADAMKTAKEATIKAFPLWLVPFLIFKYELYIGIASWVTLLTFTSVIMFGVVISAMATNRYCFGKLSKASMYWMIALALLILQPVNIQISILGIGLAIGSLIWFYSSRRSPAIESSVNA